MLSLRCRAWMQLRAWVGHWINAASQVQRATENVCRESRGLLGAAELEGFRMLTGKLLGTDLQIWNTGCQVDKAILLPVLYERVPHVVSLGAPDRDGKRHGPDHARFGCDNREGMIPADELFEFVHGTREVTPNAQTQRPTWAKASADWRVTAAAQDGSLKCSCSALGLRLRRSWLSNECVDGC